MALLLTFVSLLISLSSSELFSEKSSAAFDKKQYYSIFASADLNAINAELERFKSHTGKNAYEGALLMKKAGVISNPKSKLSVFKEGRIKLEEEIKNNPKTIEYLFLRYMIQENSPGFLGYNANLEDDKKKIIANYNSFDPVVKEAIQNYSKTSKTLSVPF